MLMLASVGCMANGQQSPKESPSPEAGSDQVSEVIRTFGGRGTLADDTPPTPAKKAVGEFKMREGFSIDLKADHHELSALEAEGSRSRHSELEEPVRVVMNGDNFNGVCGLSHDLLVM